MKKPLLIAIVLAFVAAAWYGFSPDGPFGYDEGARFAIYAGRAADQLRRSSSTSSTFSYTPKYGNDQEISVEITQGAHPVVVVRVSRGKSGAGYALGDSATVPVRLEVNKKQGPVQLQLVKEAGGIKIDGIE